MKRLIAALVLFAATSSAQQPARVVEISAKRFQFAPNEIALKKGEPVTIRLVSTDRAHGLFVKQLKVDLDAAEGRPDQVTITPAETGRFDAICDHYCGSGHGNMKMVFVVTE